MTALASTIYFPRVGDDAPPDPVPFLLTEQDAIRFLRLEGDGAETLKYYRLKGWLKGTQVGRFTRYRLPDMLAFLETAQERNPK